MYLFVVITTNPGNLIWVSGVVGFVLPHLIALVAQSHWKAGLKSVVAFITCLIAAFAICWVKGTLDFHDYIASAGIIFVMARTSYAALWRPTGIAPSLEASTTLKPAP